MKDALWEVGYQEKRGSDYCEQRNVLVHVKPVKRAVTTGVNVTKMEAGIVVMTMIILKIFKNDDSLHVVYIFGFTDHIDNCLFR